MSTGGAEVSPLPSNIWQLLSNPIRVVPEFHPTVVLPSKKQYRLIDVIIAKVLSLLLPGYGWLALSSANLRGLEFQGEALLFDIPEFDIRGRELIIGRCTPIRASVGLRQLSLDIVHVLGKSEPAHLVLVVPAGVTEQVRNLTKRDYEKSARRSLLLLSRPELERLIQHFFGSLEDIIRHCLSLENAETISQYFESCVCEKAAGPEIKSKVQEKGETGKAFQVYLEIQAPLPMVPLKLYWRWPEAVDDSGTKVPSIQLISPSAAGSRDGVQLDFTARLSLNVRLKFRSFRSGRQQLGSILLTNLEGTVRREMNLGEVYLVEQYHPVFYRDPYISTLNAFGDLLRQVEAGRIHVATVVGSGGSGKTRLCEEFGFCAEQIGFRWISRSHLNHQAQPFRIFGDLLRSLVPAPPSDERPSDVVWQYLSTLNPGLATAAATLQSAIYPYEGHNTPVTLNREILLRVLLTLLVDQSQQHPLCLHLSDLHWCSAPTLGILTEAIDRLKELDPSASTRIIFLLEGRVGESLGEPTDPAEYSHSAAVGWETFLVRTSYATTKFQINPLDSSQSRSFLEQLFENTESLDRRVPPHLIPHQDELLDAVLQRGEGNPFHMIEQIRLLRHYRFIEQNSRTGLLFLSQPIPISLEVPSNVEGLIRKRFHYLQSQGRGRAALIRAIALTGDRINTALFEMLRERLCPEASLEPIIKSEFLHMPRHGAGEVRFRHENYYQVIRNMELSERDAVVSVYGEWLERQEATAEVLFQRGFVAAQAARPDLECMRSLFFESWKQSEAQKNYPLSVKVLEHLLQRTLSGVPADADRFHEVMRYRALLAKRITWTGDWEHARSLYMELIRTLSKCFEERSTIPGNVDWGRLDYELHSGHVELANVEIQLLRYGDAIDRLEHVIPEIEAIVRVTKDLPSEWGALHIRCLNRLAVAQWFEGELVQAFLTLRRAYRLATSLGDTLQVSIQLRDLGTVRIHTNPSRGGQVLASALNLLSQANHLPRQEYILQYHIVIANLINSQRDSAKSCRECAQSSRSLLEEIYVKARREGYIHEEVGTALLVGVCHALLSSSEAIRWLKRSVSSAHRAGILEFLWKAHLNLAQVCLAQDQSLWEGAGLHAQQAQKLIDLDLSRRRDLNYVKRSYYYRLPMAQLTRIWRTLNDSRDRALVVKYPELEAFFDTTTSLVEQRHDRRQPLHVTSGDCDFFMMS